MAVPWMQILDVVIGVTDLARSRRAWRMASGSEHQRLEVGSRALGGLETRLAGVVVAALKEAFDRDTRRLELERQQLEAERFRAERALKLELVRQAADREIGRLRLIAGAGIVAWMATLFLAIRIVASGSAARVPLGGGWLLLLAGIAASFTAQSQLTRGVQQVVDETSIVSGGRAGAVALWSVVGGLALVGVAVLMS